MDLGKPQSPKRIEYSIGFILMSVYIFTSYVAVDVTISSSYNTLALYAFLAWGLLTTMLYGLREKIPTYTVWYLIFMSVSLLTMIYSPVFSILSGQFYLMIVSFFVTYFVQMFVTDEKDFEKLCWVYALSSLVLVLMLQFTGNLVGTADERLGGDIVGNANTFAIMIMVAVLLELWLLVYNAKTPAKKLLLLSLVLYNMYALALSAGRKFFLLPFIFLYLLLFFKTNKQGKRNVILYTVILAVIGILALNMVMNIPVLYEAIGTRLEASLDKTDTESEAYYSSKIRKTMREDAIEQWKEKPFLGHGFDSYKYRAKKVVGHFYYSHCNFTELLYNGGLVYFLVYYWIYYKLIKDCCRKKGLHQRYKSFILAIAISLFIFDYGAVLYSATNIQILLALACKALSFDMVKADSEEEIHEQN